MNTIIVEESFANHSALQRKFLKLLPRIEACARCLFRDLRCAQKRADSIAETVALAWSWFVSLARRGKDASKFAAALATLAARAVRSGRRLAGQERGRDVLSFVAQCRHGFGVSRLPDISTLEGNVWDEALQDNSQSPVPDQVCFRMDFPRWRRRQTERNRRVIDDLAVGERTQVVARQHGLTAPRVSQLRRHFHADWEHFCSDPCKMESRTGAALALH